MKASSVPFKNKTHITMPPIDPAMVMHSPAIPNLLLLLLLTTVVIVPIIERRNPTGIHKNAIAAKGTSASFGKRLV